MSGPVTGPVGASLSCLTPLGVTVGSALLVTSCGSSGTHAVPSRGYKDQPAPSSLSLSMPGSWGPCSRPCWCFPPPAAFWPFPFTFVLLSVRLQPNKVVICFSIRIWVLESHCVAFHRAWVVTGPNTSLINWPISSQCHLYHTWAMFGSHALCQLPTTLLCQLHAKCGPIT